MGKTAPQMEHGLLPKIGTSRGKFSTFHKNHFCLEYLLHFSREISLCMYITKKGKYAKRAVFLVCTDRCRCVLNTSVRQVELNLSYITIMLSKNILNVFI